MDDSPPTPSGRSDVRLPADSLRALSRAALDGDEATGRALLEAGRRAGSSICSEVASEVDPSTDSMASFWDAARAALSERGLGDASYEHLDGGVAEIRLSGGPEAGAARENGAGPAGCPFATGLVAGLLSEAAGAPVAVLEVACRSGGAEACRFLVGDEPRLRTIRRHVLDGVSLEEAIGSA